MVIAKDEHNQENGAETESYGQTGAKHYSCNDGEWAHGAHFT